MQARRTRIHLVIDTSGSARFWAMVREAEQAGAQATAEAERLVPFAPESQVPLRLERYSASPVMAPGECSALVEDLIADFLANPANDARLASAYAALLRGFAQDWRQLWQLHGAEPEGLAHYRRLIAATRARLHPDRRALTTASNGIGVNRGLRAARAERGAHGVSERSRSHALAVRVEPPSHAP